MPAESLARLRDLGHLEKYSSTRHALGLYHNVSVTASYFKSTDSSTQPLVTVVYQALAKVIQLHPILSAIPVEEDLPTAHFLRLPSVDLKHAVTFIEREQVSKAETNRDIELDEVLEQQHNTNFKAGLGDSPYWRLIILHNRADTSNFVASFVFHHSLADGGSGLAFHRSFHVALVEVNAGPALDIEPQSVVVSPETALVPSLEQLHPLPLSIWFILLALWNSIFPTKAAKLWTGPPIDFAYQKRRIRTVAFSCDRTSALIAASRAQTTSLTAVVSAALAAAVFCNLDAARWEILRASMPISLRHILPSDTVTNDTLGVYVSQAQTTYKRSDLIPQPSDGLSPSGVWAAARAAKMSLNTAVARNGRNDVVGMLRWAGPLKTYLEQKQGKQPETSFEFSNVGVFRYATQPAQGSWTIGKVIFAQDGNVVGPVFQTAGATGPDGELTVSFAWLDGQVEEEWMDSVVNDFELQVGNLLAAEP